MKAAAKAGRATRPDLKLGVCGEHGGDPESVHFFHEVGLDYVSCSPFRIPVARLEAAEFLTSLASRVRAFELVGTPVRNPNREIRNFTSLPVRLVSA